MLMWASDQGGDSQIRREVDGAHVSIICFSSSVSMGGGESFLLSTTEASRDGRWLLSDTLETPLQGRVL